MHPAPTWMPEPVYVAEGVSVMRRFDAAGRVILRLSLAPVAAVTTRVKPETLTAAVRTVNECGAAVGSRFPAGSRARTEKVWEPSPRCEMVFGELQLA